MEDSIVTNHTELNDDYEAPAALQPFVNMTDLNQYQFIQADESLDAAIKNYFKQGDQVSGLDENSRNNLESVYNNLLESYSGVSSDEKLAKDAEKALKNQQKQENKQAKKDNRSPEDFIGNEQYKERFIQNYVEQQRQNELDAIARIAKSEAMSACLAPESQYAVEEAIKDQQKMAETQNLMNNALDFLKYTHFEYLTRGALLACTGGAVYRYLNLPKDHGLFFGKKSDPVINLDDCETGDEYNITSFGLCDGADPPAERIKVKDLVQANQKGLYQEAQNEDAIERGFLCIPEIVAPGWINTYGQTELGWGKATVSTKSYLVCSHGGLIFPLNSGQHPELQLLLSDTDAKEEFDKLCDDYRTMKAECDALLEEIKNDFSYYDSGSADDRLVKYSELCDTLRTQRNEIESCMDQLRTDSYRGDYEEIREERKATLGYMLGTYAGLFGDPTSVKSDYYAYGRQYGYNQKSAYNQDDPGFSMGSDAYVDWHAGRIENMSEEEAKQEYETWKEEVNDRGYENLSDYEKEEFDRKGKMYGTKR